MKLYLKNSWIVFVFVICAKLATGQQIILKSDTIPYGTDSVATLVLPDYRGELNWQVSYDQIEWINFPNETKDSLLVDLDMDAWYRAGIIDGTCDTVYSDTAQVIISDSLREHYQSIVLPVAYPDEPGEIVEVFFNNDTITCRKVDDEYVFQGDMILTEKQVMQLNGNKGASIPTDDMFLKLWPEGKVFYTIDFKFTNIDNIEDAIKYWEERTPLEFIPRTNEENYLKFNRIIKGANSRLGMIGGEQKINLPDNADKYTIRHEIGHTVGLIHEQSRKDRDDYIIVLNHNIIEASRHNYDLIQNSFFLGAFDFESLMLYPCFNQYNINSDVPTMVNKDTFKPWDSDKVHRELSNQDIVMVEELYATAPVVKTAGVTNVFENKAFLGGNVINDGGSAITETGFCWNKAGNPSFNDDGVKVNGGLGHFSIGIENLQPNTTYFVKAYAKNNKGISYGNEINFTTYSNYSPPAVVTNPVEFEIILTDEGEIKKVKVYCGGEITDNGGLGIKERGVCWNLLGNPNNSDKKCLDENNMVGSFTLDLTDSLDVKGASGDINTTYYLKAFATNQKGTSFGNEIVFNHVFLDNILPIIITEEITDISQTSATFNGVLLERKAEAINHVGFCWNTLGNPSVRNDKQSTILNGNTFTGNISNLTPNTTYYVRTYANIKVDIAGVSKNIDIYGNQLIFTTLANSQPTVTTSAATNVTASSAILNGEVTSDGGVPITQRGFYWSATDQTPDANDNKEIVSGTTGNFSKTISGLQPNTTYYFRAFATNGQGTTTGDVLSFKTTQELSLPTVQTNAVTSVTASSGTLNGNVTSDGNATITQRGFYWSETNDTPDSGDNKEIVSGTTGSFTKTISELQPNTTYYFRAFATNSKGTTTGDVLSFKTTQELSLPTVQTNAATDISTSSGTLNGNVSSDGNATITQRGFYWSETNGTPDSGDNKEIVSGTTGTYSKSINSLQSNTTYYFRAFATNSKGTTTGDVLSFKTAQELSLPTVQTNAATDISTSSGTLNGNVTSDGNATITQRGFYWSETNQTPNDNDNKEIVSGTTGTYSRTISSLQANTTYYYSAFATNSEGTATEEVLSFKTSEEQGNETGTFTDSRDGNTYKWVKIGEQVWMAENLAYLPEVSSASEGSYNEKHYYVNNYYGNDIATAKSKDNYKIFGVLYNWPATMEVCPEGWHLPSDTEWSILLKYLMDNGYGWDYYNSIAKAIASKDYWNVNLGVGYPESVPGVNPELNNSSGFNGLPAGLRGTGYFTVPGRYGNYWSSTPFDDNNAWYIHFAETSSKVSIYYNIKELGYSIRCIKD
jgi:uncharacterized protein (TIGR02145 family)